MLNSLEHGVAFPRTLEINDILPYLHFCVAMQRKCDSLHHLFHSVHHPFVILIRHIELHLGEFGVMEAVHTFVAEVFGKLINAIETTHNQFFQIQLVCNTQIERHIQRVMVSFERTGCSTAIQWLQNWCFHFQIAFFIQIVTHSVNQQRALDEGIFDMRVHDKVNVTLAIALLRILESIIYYTVFFFDDGQRAYRLAENGKLLHVDADFTCLCDKHEALHTDNIADIQFLEHAVIHRFVFTRTNLVTFGIDLDFAHCILKHVKRNSAHDALAHDTSSDTYLLEFGVVFRKLFENFSGGGIHFIFGCRIGINAEIQ